MQKLLILSITISGFIFAGNWGQTNTPSENSEPVKKYAFAEDTSKDDCTPEGRRKSGKGGRKRRRGGSGLR